MYVYLVLGGVRTYRVEAAVWILLATLVPLIGAPSHGSRQESVEMDLPVRALLLTGASAMWLLVLAPRFSASFLSDDFVFLEIYRTPSDLLRSPEFFRPMFAVVFWSLVTIGRGSVVAFHVASAILHTAAAILVYVLVRRVMHSDTGAAIGTAVFIVNPLQLEATLWVSGLQELLWTVCLLSALAVYTKQKALSVSALAATLVILTLALLSKETAICFVIMIPAADWLFFRFSRGPLLPWAYVAYPALATTYLAVHRRFASPHAQFFQPPSRYFLKQMLGTPYSVFVQPWNVQAVDVPPMVSAALCVGLVALVTWRALIPGEARRLIVGPAVVLLSTLPLYSFFFVGRDLSSARYLYFAAIGWSLLVAQLLTGIGRRTAALLTAITLIVGSALCLRFNTRPWDVASDFVLAVRDAARRGEDPTRAVERMATERGIKLTRGDSAPDSYQGVTIFRNGFPEFLRQPRED